MTISLRITMIAILFSAIAHGTHDTPNTLLAKKIIDNLVVYNGLLTTFSQELSDNTNANDTQHRLAELKRYQHYFQHVCTSKKFAPSSSQQETLARLLNSANNKLNDMESTLLSK